jgi:hypothetical protein
VGQYVEPIPITWSLHQSEGNHAADGYLFIEITSCLRMIYIIAIGNILATPTITIEKTERSLPSGL